MCASRFSLQLPTYVLRRNRVAQISRLAATPVDSQLRILVRARISAIRAFLFPAIGGSPEWAWSAYAGAVTILPAEPRLASLRQSTAPNLPGEAKAVTHQLRQ